MALQAMPLEDDLTISEELRTLGYEQIAAFDEEATDGEALAFYENSQIDNAVVYRNKLSGRVGNFLENYLVRITLHSNEITNVCTCDSERKICPHAIALLYGWVNDAADFMNVATVLKEVAKIDKSRLLDVVANIIQQQPHMVDLFLARTKLDWDEIDPEPNS